MVNINIDTGYRILFIDIFMYKYYKTKGTATFNKLDIRVVRSSMNGNYVMD